MTRNGQLSNSTNVCSPSHLSRIQLNKCMAFRLRRVHWQTGTEIVNNEIDGTISLHFLGHARTIKSFFDFGVG